MKLRFVLVAALLAAGCQQQEQANCPDKYEGQPVTVAGKITKTASFLGLATLSTIQDAKGGVCLVTSKASIGNEGDSVRLTNMVAIHDEKTIVPNFLRRADEVIPTASPVAATTSPPTRPPTPTPQPAIVLKVGSATTYTDGWKVSVVRTEPQAPSRFSTPKPGTQFLAVLVRYVNVTAKEASYNSFSWKIQDSAGVRRGPSFSSDRSDSLNSGKLAPGGFVTGSIVFEVPIGDVKLAVIYEDFSYKQATWELY